MTTLDQLVLTADERARGRRLDEVVLCLDWSGEEEPGQLARHIAARVRAFGKPTDGLDAAEVYATANDPSLGRGEFLVRLLDHLTEAASDLGFTVVSVGTGSDEYQIMVAATSDPADLDGLTYAGCPVGGWGANGTTLVSLTCPHCDAMQVWDLPTGESLADEACDCGTPLFDGDARPLPGVVLHS